MEPAAAPEDRSVCTSDAPVESRDTPLVRGGSDKAAAAADALAGIFEEAAGSSKPTKAGVATGAERVAAVTAEVVVESTLVATVERAAASEAKEAIKVVGRAAAAIVGGAWSTAAGVAVTNAVLPMREVAGAAAVRTSAAVLLP